MAIAQAPKPFVVSPDDPLVKEHTAVVAWVEDALSTLGERDFYADVDLKTVSSGQALLEGNPAQSRRYVMAAVAQARHWDQLAAQLEAEAENDIQRANKYRLSGWPETWSRRRHATLVVNALMRRNVPFAEGDLLTLLDWCCGSESMSTYHYPVGPLARALQRYTADHEASQTLRQAMQQFARRLRASHDKDAKRFGTAVEQLCGQGEAEPTTATSAPPQPPPSPGPVGSPQVLLGLKRELNMLPDEAGAATTMIGPDRFECGGTSPLQDMHELLSDLFVEVVGTPHYYNPNLKEFEAGRRLLKLEATAMGRGLLAAAERHVNALMSSNTDPNDQTVSRARSAAASVATSLLERDFEMDRAGTFDLLLYLSVLPAHRRTAVDSLTPKLIAEVTRQSAVSPLTDGERFVLSLFRGSLVTGPALGNPSDEVKTLTGLINDGAAFYLAPGEVWSDAVNGDMSGLDTSQRSAWSALFLHALSANAARPTAKWLKTARSLVQAIGFDQVREAFLRWFPRVAEGRSIRRLRNYVGATGGGDIINEESANCLRGLLWCVPLLPKCDDLARCVTAVALSAYKKIPGVGPRAVKVGNAAVYALSELASKESVGQLAMLKVRVKFGTAQKEIEKAFDAAASALALPRDQIEELGVPSYGLEEVGRLSEVIGDYRVELLVSGSDAELKWSDANGKPLKSVPAKVKAEHKEDLKELQQSLKDIRSMLPAQRDRLDGMFLLEKSWPIADWRERYHDHPLVGTIAQRLIWCIDGTAAIFDHGTPTDVLGAPIRHGTTAEVTLWHPVGRSVDEVTSWRRRLEELAITQPFKQAHREVYLLTDAERNTRTYSNRFAAHVIRQHQFNALCAARSWKNKLRLLVDDTYPPASRELPQWGLRAEFWIEGIGHDYGIDTNDTGTYLRLATDQVRFYRTEAAQNYAHAGGGGYGSRAYGPGDANLNEPLPLEEVPPLVFSEIMRDVDLFVGVASVGNDPTWQDGGPQGRYRDYWQTYSFGELSGTATTRKQVLERLVPRMKIAKRCSFSDRFLVVRGDKRTYKIHMGSGNILMEPNDQYLCIVPDARTRPKQDDLYLPFDGDSTLSIIISKALLLAEDTKIKDPTITRQIDNR